MAPGSLAKTTICIDIGKIQFATWLQKLLDTPEHSMFVRG